MKEKKITEPNISLYSKPHQDAIKNKEDNFRAWQYNVADHFKGCTTEEIKEKLQQTANPFAVCFENWINDFNMATGIRNANAFNAKQVFYVGTKKWDRRGAVGTYNYTPVEWLETTDKLIELSKEYTFVGIDNVPGSVSIGSYVWPERPMLIFGEEGVGLTPWMKEICQNIVHIDMYGSVRSLNCGVASGIAMNDFVSKYRG